MRFSFKNFFSNCDKIRSFMRIWSHIMKKSLMESFIFRGLKPHLIQVYHVFLVPDQRNLSYLKVVLVVCSCQQLVKKMWTNNLRCWKLTKYISWKLHVSFKTKGKRLMETKTAHHFFNTFQPSNRFHIETSHLICNGNRQEEQRKRYFLEEKGLHKIKNEFTINKHPEISCQLMNRIMK